MRGRRWRPSTDATRMPGSFCTLRFLEWACGEDDDVDNPRVVKRANPASWVSVDQLRAARASLPDLAHRRFVANQWTERGHWLPPGSGRLAPGTGLHRWRADRRRRRHRRRAGRLGGRLDQRAPTRRRRGSHRRSGGARHRRGRPRAGRAVRDRRVRLRPVAGRADRPGARAARGPGLGLPAARRADDPGQPAAL